LAGLFAVRYFESLTASLKGLTQPSTAWCLAYAHAAYGRTLPTQDALFGINAHINYDLAQGLYDNILFADAASDAQQLLRFRHDHDAINRILQDSLPECLQLLANRYGCAIARLVVHSDRLHSAVCRMTLLMLQLWRDRVWEDVLKLLAAKKESEREATLSGMNRDSGRIAALFGIASTLLGELPAQARRALGTRFEVVLERDLPAQAKGERRLVFGGLAVVAVDGRQAAIGAAQML
jgi:hypothetical protein